MPELEQYKGIIIPAIIIIAIIFFMFAAGYRKAPPDKAFIISGLRRKAKVVIGKAAIKLPFFERCDTLELALMSVDVKTAQPVPTGDYININKVGAIGLLAGMVAVLAFPPSPLFVSELMILSQTIASTGWWLAAVMVLLLCIVIYSICYRVIKLCYQPNQDELHLSKINRRLSYGALSLLMAAIVLGLWQPAPLRAIIDRIATL